MFAWEWGPREFPDLIFTVLPTILIYSLVSQFQRDLTDSTVLRNMGEALGHSLLAYKSALQGIAKLQVIFYTVNLYGHLT